MLQQYLDKVESPFWAWNIKAGRYFDRSTGRFLSQANLEKLQKRHISFLERDIQMVGELLLRGQISLRTWQEATATAMKTLWLHQAVLGKGGLKQMSASDYLAVGRQLRTQYSWLRDFAIDINRGYSVSEKGQQIPLTEARFRQRLKLYARAGRVSFQTGQQEVAKSQGKYFMWRTLGLTDRHCSECVSYRAAGVRPVGGLPLPGQACSCRANCLCKVFYSGSLAEAMVLRGEKP